MAIMERNEDDKYIALQFEKADFLDVKKKIPVIFENAKLAFINSSARLVFYQK